MKLFKQLQNHFTKTEGSSSDYLSETETIIKAPISGKVIALENVPDEMFSKGFLGKGIAIIPSEGKFVAPCDGEIVVVAPTKHAVGIKSTKGIEVLIHIGLKTELLSGNEFKAKVKVGDKVKTGDVLIDFDFAKVSKGYDLTTVIVITNTADFVDVLPVKVEHIKKAEQLILVI